MSAVLSWTPEDNTERLVPDPADCDPELFERTLARVCREAGATVRCNAKLRDMNVRVHATDERSIEVLASGLAMNHGAQLAVGHHPPQCSDCQRESVSQRQWTGQCSPKPDLTKRPSMPSLSRVIGASSSLSASKRGDGGAMRPRLSSKDWQLRVLVRRPWPSVFHRFSLGGSGGAACSPCRAAGHFAGLWSRLLTIS